MASELKKENNESRVLVFRLSSIGDVVLATSALSVFQNKAMKVDWVVAKECVELLENHPSVGRIYAFDRKAGFGEWVSLCMRLWAVGYSEIYDLHLSLRTRLARLLFWYFWAKSGKKKPKWHLIRKEFVRRTGYFVFRNLWPKSLRPTRWVTKYAQTVGGTGKERPSLLHLLATEDGLDIRLMDWQAKDYLCVMPSSIWPGKRWPTEYFLSFVQNLTVLPVILGTEKDDASQELYHKLEEQKIEMISGIGRWGLRETAQVLSRSIGYFGNDTGLAHIAEAVGVPAYIIYGPTTPDVGFGPWRDDSRSISASMWCRPCGKDGRYCFRANRYACMKNLVPEEAFRKAERLSNAPRRLGNEVRV